jgi:hypothetical protein
VTTDMFRFETGQHLIDLYTKMKGNWIVLTCDPVTGELRGILPAYHLGTLGRTADSVICVQHIFWTIPASKALMDAIASFVIQLECDLTTSYPLLLPNIPNTHPTIAMNMSDKYYFPLNTTAADKHDLHVRGRLTVGPGETFAAGCLPQRVYLQILTQ